MCSQVSFQTEILDQQLSALCQKWGSAQRDQCRGEAGLWGQGGSLSWASAAWAVSGECVACRGLSLLTPSRVVCQEPPIAECTEVTWLNGKVEFQRNYKLLERQQRLQWHIPVYILGTSSFPIQNEKLLYSLCVKNKCNLPCRCFKVTPVNSLWLCSDEHLIILYYSSWVCVWKNMRPYSAWEEERKLLENCY